VEYYDFSESARDMRGNDAACTFTLANLDTLYLLAGAGGQSLITWMQENFKGQFDIRAWQEQHNVAFHTQREDWA
jgi:hypothetical protein